jgi:orotate phosphoribosyltransferase
MDSSRDILIKNNALCYGHFVLSSGLHSDQYCQCARLFENPADAGQIAAKAAAHWNNDQIDVVVAPALGGILWGYELARALGVRTIFAERDANQKFALRRGFDLEPGTRVLLAEDVVTTGGSVMELVPLMEEAGAEVCGIASIVDRSGGKFQPEYKFNALVELDAKTWTPEECPLCRAGSIAVKPGSRKIPPANVTRIRLSNG